MTHNMKNEYRRKTNPKIVALIIEASLLIIGVVVVLIFDAVKKPLNIIPVVIVSGVLVFALFLTLSLIRYDAFREIRSDFKETNLPLYTDPTTMICHDLIDEAEEKKKD